MKYFLLYFCFHLVYSSLPPYNIKSNNVLHKSFEQEKSFDTPGSYLNHLLDIFPTQLIRVQELVDDLIKLQQKQHNTKSNRIIDPIFAPAKTDVQQPKKKYNKINQHEQKDTLPDCVTFPRDSLWQSSHGDCSIYSDYPSAYFCSLDKNINGTVLANQACAECGLCNKKTGLTPSFISTYGSPSNAETNTVTIVFDQAVQNFDINDIIFNSTTTGAVLSSFTGGEEFYSPSNKNQWMFRLVITESKNLGNYSIKISPNTDAVDSNGDPIQLGAGFLMTIDFCSSHYDCGNGRYCYECAKCLTLFGQNSCGSCSTSRAGTGSCGSLSSCERNGDSIDSQCPEVSNACECTSNGYSGTVQTNRIGCESWEEYLAPICYVADPTKCNNSVASTSFTGAKWRYCNVTTTSDCPVGTCVKNNSNCVLYNDGYHCEVSQCSNVPDWANCRINETTNVFFYSYNPKQTNSTFQCKNHGIQVSGVGSKYICDDLDVSKSTYDSRTALSFCTRTTEPIKVCVCPEDYTGTLCQFRRNLQCVLESDIDKCDSSYSRTTRNDYQIYDTRLTGDPICHPIKCHSEKFSIIGSINCSIANPFDSAQFIADTGVKMDEYVVAVSELQQYYIYANNGLILSSDPRLYFEFEMIDLGNLFISGSVVGRGVNISDVNVKVQFLGELDVPSAVKKSSTMITAGRVYTEFSLNSLTNLSVRPQRFFLDCIDFEVGDKPKTISTTTIILIAIFGFLGISIAAGLIWKWRLVQESKKGKKD
eukprot:c21211_g1_i1.p1 GENE.c21211_g1_i1~~c21211_g1_i1.p1  ORF type:complete len:760 (+),score=276.89 c21211_g1_i1:46-2325(+)